MNSMDKIIIDLPNRTAAELKVIHERCSALLAIGPKANAVNMDKGTSDFAADLYKSIDDLLFERTRVRNAPYLVFLKTSNNAAKYKEAALAAANANATWFPKQTRAERLSMCGIYARVILDYIAAREWVAVWPTINHRIGELPVLVEDAFPGYAANGMLGKVQTMRTQPARYDY